MKVNVLLHIDPFSCITLRVAFEGNRSDISSGVKFFLLAGGSAQEKTLDIVTRRSYFR